MTSGLVYLRPATVAFIRVAGARNVAADLAWAEMNAWIEKTNLRGEFERGYGLMRVDHPDGRGDSYDACIELPPHVEISRHRNLKLQKLPGGAYARSRHNGPHSDLNSVIGGLVEKWQNAPSLQYDPQRPTIEIYLNDPIIVAPEKLRTDVCLPVGAGASRQWRDHAA